MVQRSIGSAIKEGTGWDEVVILNKVIEKGILKNKGIEWQKRAMIIQVAL